MHGIYVAFKSVLVLLQKVAEICTLKQALNFFFLHCPDMNPAEICIFNWPLSNYNLLSQP